MKPDVNQALKSTHCELLTPNEAATLLKITTRGVYQLVRQRRLESVRIGPRLIRIFRADLNAYLEEQRNRGAP